MSYRLLTYVAGGQPPRAGLLIGDSVVDLEQAVRATKSAVGQVNLASTLSVIEAWTEMEPLLAKIAANPSALPAGKALKDVQLCAPLLYPRNIYCAAANYYDHYREMHNGKERDKNAMKPYFFLKSTQAVVGPNDAILYPSHSKQLDWEAEIGVVIGKAARNVKASDALDYVAGYTIVNELSLRDILVRSDWAAVKTDWAASKSFETGAPMGPWITPRSEIRDPQALRIQTWVDDGIEQDTNSKDMIYTIREQIEFLSARITLAPGDVISTGTGGGVGEAKGRFMNAGQRCKVTIEGLGTLDNPIKAA